MIGRAVSRWCTAMNPLTDLSASKKPETAICLEVKQNSCNLSTLAENLIN